LYLNSGRVTR